MAVGWERQAAGLDRILSYAGFQRSRSFYSHIVVCGVFQSFIEFEPCDRVGKRGIGVAIYLCLVLGRRRQRRGQDAENCRDIGDVIVFALQRTLQDGINTHGLAGYALQFAPNVIRLDQFFGQRISQLRVVVAVNLDLWISSHAAACRIDRNNDLIRGIFYVRRHRRVRVVDAGIRCIGIRWVFARHRRDHHIAQIFARVVGLYRVIKVHGYALAHSQLRDQGVSALPYIAVSLHGSDGAGCIGKYVLQTDVGEIHRPVIRDGRSIANGIAYRRKSRVRKFDNGNAAPVHGVGIGVWLAVWIDRHNYLIRGILGVRVDGFLRVNAVSGVIRIFRIGAGHRGDGHIGNVLTVIRFHHFIRIGDRDGFTHRQPVDRPCAAVLVPGITGAARSGDPA